MAFQMSYTDQYGDAYPLSYWRCIETNICKEQQRGQVVFYGFPDAAHKGKRIIGQKAYNIDVAAYGVYFTPAAVDPLNVNHVSQAYAMAMATLDTDSGQKDKDGKPVMVSFFNGATEV